MKILEFLLIIGTLASFGAAFGEFSGRIVNGRNCTKEESTYLISIANTEQNGCGGSLIAPKWMVSAGHCCNGVVRMGLHRLTVLAGQTIWLQDVEQTSSVEKIFIPPDYTLQPLTSDVCLIKLKKPINPSTKVKFSKLATTEEFEEMRQNGKCNNALVMGHGRQIKILANTPEPNDYTEPKPNPRTQCINMKMAERKDCQDRPGTGRFLSETVFCMQDTVGGTCEGDSGGPLFCQDLQIGVVSAGLGCADPRFAVIFARVDLHKRYFEGIMRMEES